MARMHGNASMLASIAQPFIHTVQAFSAISKFVFLIAKVIVFLTRFNKIAIQGTPQMAVDKEAICLSRVYSYYPKCNFPLFYV